MTRVHLELTRSLDVAAWTAAWDRGLRPDRYPYGLDRLARPGLELTVRPPVAPGPSDRFVGGPFRRLTGGLEVAEALRDRSGRRGADVVLAWDERAGIPAALRARVPGEPPVVTGVIWLTEPDAIANRAARALARVGLPRARAVFALSPAQLDVLADRAGVAHERLHLLPFGVDADFWGPAAEAERAGPVRVFSAGNDRHRDHDLLVRAFDRVARACPGTELAVVTERDLATGTAPVEHHRSLDHVAMRDQYARASVVAVAVRPNLLVAGITVVVEAMFAGLPVVTTRSPG
ncbi:MAG: glycosyltransferase, partial [Acidimicrobiia bacterium]